MKLNKSLSISKTFLQRTKGLSCSVDPINERLFVSSKTNFLLNHDNNRGNLVAIICYCPSHSQAVKQRCFQWPLVYAKGCPGTTKTPSLSNKDARDHGVMRTQLLVTMEKQNYKAKI